MKANTVTDIGELGCFVVAFLRLPPPGLVAIGDAQSIFNSSSSCNSLILYVVQFTRQCQIVGMAVRVISGYEILSSVEVFLNAEECLKGSLF
ncbi:hypothetical protein KFK09_020796 [Dendrobium nobile]|uniref:Uncharacterized protein n=1 Tax=Dendrobium nobile TaxID=94219 RepID=A0A8T3AU01_DENNO|nr:hypothetical protein KFK09_020796 [Dendrobium nobile]